MLTKGIEFNEQFYVIYVIIIGDEKYPKARRLAK